MLQLQSRHLVSNDVESYKSNCNKVYLRLFITQYSVTVSGLSSMWFTLLKVHMQLLPKNRNFYFLDLDTSRDVSIPAEHVPTSVRKPETGAETTTKNSDSSESRHISGPVTPFGE